MATDGAVSMDAAESPASVAASTMTDGLVRIAINMDANPAGSESSDFLRTSPGFGSASVLPMEALDGPRNPRNGF